MTRRFPVSILPAARMVVVACGLGLIGADCATAQGTIPRWSLGPPAMTYGGPGLEFALSEDPLVTIARDDAVYIADEGNLRLFESDGRLTRVFGGSGQRAGEFVLISAMGWLGDTLWVIDEALDRATFFEPTGRVLTAMRVSVPGTAGTAPPAVPFALLVNSSAVALIRPHPGTTPAGIRPRGPLVRLSRRGIPADTFATVTLDETLLQGRDRIARPLPQPFSDATLFAATPDGNGVIVVERPAATAPGEAHYRVTRYAVDGETVFSVQHPYIAQPIPRPVIDSVRAELVARQARGFGGRAGAEEVVQAALVAPDYLAPVADILVGRDGSIWLAQNALPSRDRRPPTYDVLAPDGRRIATFALPTRGAVVAADLTTVWVAEPGDRHLVQVVRYPIRKD